MARSISRILGTQRFALRLNIQSVRMSEELESQPAHQKVDSRQVSVVSSRTHIPRLQHRDFPPSALESLNAFHLGSGSLARRLPAVGSAVPSPRQTT